MCRKTLLLGIVIICLLQTVCQAVPVPVIDPSVDLKRSTDLEEYYRQERELRREKTGADPDSVVDKTEQKLEKNQQDDIILYVNRIQVDQSDILTVDEIKAITVKYEGRKLKPSDLYKAVSEINDLYKNKKYITAKAVLPPQTIQDGVVRIQLVEGRFGELLLEGNRYTRSVYITDRISLHKGDLVKLDQLQNDIFYFNNTNDVRLRAELRPGKVFGTTDCVLRMEEPDQWQTTLFSDNAGRSESGLYRVGMVISNASLFGNREALVISPSWTNGTLAGAVSYTFPIDNLGTRMGLSYSKNQVDIISGPYETMDIQGDSADVGISLTHPLLVQPKRKVDAYLELHRRNSSTDFSGATLLDSEVKTAATGFSIRTIDDKGVWSSQYSLTQIEASQKDSYNGHSFSRFNLSAVRQQVIDEDEMLIWRLSGQLTHDHELPSSEEFSLGGMSSVKGFVEGLASGEMGYYAGLEYNFPLTFSEKIKGLVFVDHGGVYNRYNNGAHGTDHLTSAGFGITLNYAPDFFGKIVAGFPIDSSREHDKGRIHFLFQSSLK